MPRTTANSRFPDLAAGARGPGDTGSDDPFTGPFAGPLAGLPPLWTPADEAEYRARWLRRHRRRRQARVRQTYGQRVRWVTQEQPKPTIDWPVIIQRSKALAALAGLFIAGWAVASAMYSPAAAMAADSKKRDLVCSETGQTFPQHAVAAGATLPLINPATGNATLYPAEPCYWTADGGVTREPTLVLLNMYRGGDPYAPTICPGCGREVIYMNPPPPAELFE